MSPSLKVEYIFTVSISAGEDRMSSGPFFTVGALFPTVSTNDSSAVRPSGSRAVTVTVACPSDSIDEDHMRVEGRTSTLMMSEFEEVAVNVRSS